MTDPVPVVPWYRDRPFVFATVCIVIAAGLLVAGYITDVDWLDFSKYVVGAFLGGTQ